MSSRLTAFNARVDRGHDEWQEYVGLPYTIAYAAAYESFQKTMTEQRAANEAEARAQAELFVLAASVVTGSFMMAAFATASLRQLAGRATISALSRLSLDIVYRDFAQSALHRTALFATGKILDHVKGEVKKTVTDHIAKLGQEASNIISGSPVVRGAQVELHMLRQANGAKRVAEAIDSSTEIDARAKDEAFAILAQAPIANPPTKGIEQQRLANKIELAMLMRVVLESDFLTQHPHRPLGAKGSMIPTSTPISQLPGDADYPRATRPSMSFSGMSAHQTVTVRPIGDIVEAKIELLHRDVLGGPFNVAGDRASNQDRHQAALNRAVPTLRALANQSRPLQLAQVRL